MSEEYCDFIVKIYKSSNIKIEILCSHFSNIEESFIQIDGKTYKIIDETVIDEINNIVSDNLNALIMWSKQQTNEYLDNNAVDGGAYREIRIKYGQLMLKINGQVRDIRKQCDEFIDELKDIILMKCEKYDYINNLFNYEFDREANEVDEELEKYLKLFNERFSREAYFPEPHGTRELVIESIKKCLEVDKDILDELYYPDDDPNILY